MINTIKAILNSMWSDANQLDIVLFAFTILFIFITLGVFVVSPLSIMSLMYIRAMLVFSLVWYIKYLFYKNR